MWIKELPRVAIEATTSECADVLNELKYPVKGYLPANQKATRYLKPQHASIAILLMYMIFVFPVKGLISKLF